ncbi:MAG: VacJ family lipoprotein [Desulfobacterales bacterium]|nr:VacJ family lipoprotein [Desulfobacterales bacterium]
MHRRLIYILLFMGFTILWIRPCVADNTTYYNSDGSTISEAEYGDICAQRSMKLAEMKHLLKADPEKPSDFQASSTTSFKSRPADSGSTNAVIVAQAASDAAVVENDTTDSDEYEEDEYEDEEETELIADPFIELNKGFYLFNDTLYFWLLKPVAQGYGFVIPEEIRTSIKNVFYNIRFPVRFINCLLQGKGKKAGAEFGSFFLNTTVGFLGMANVASHYPHLDPSPEDFGQTFAVWGFGNGVYFMFPVFGPSSFRDGIGLVGDSLSDPIFWATLNEEWWVSPAIRAGETVNATSLRIGDYEAIKEAALDPYVAIRNAYVQNRNKLIAE